MGRSRRGGERTGGTDLSLKSNNPSLSGGEKSESESGILLGILLGTLGDSWGFSGNGVNEFPVESLIELEPRSSK